VKPRERSSRSAAEATTVIIHRDTGRSRPRMASTRSSTVDTRVDEPRTANPELQLLGALRRWRQEWEQEPS